MKNLSELSTSELLNVIEENDSLSNRLYELIEQSSMYWVGEKLEIIRNSLKDWSIGFYNYNFLDVVDYEKFVDSLVEYKGIFGLSDKADKLLSHCLKLRWSNLFDYYAERLKDLILDEEFNSETDINNNDKETMEYYTEIYADQFDDYLINDDGDIVQQTIVGHVA